VLQVRGVSKRFGGLQANSEVSFDVAAGEIVGLVGPNGAGKTTLFDLVTGFQRPDSGSILFEGRELVGLRPDQINRGGVARTFQRLRPFLDLTVEENVAVAALTRGSGLRAAWRVAREQLAEVGLLEQADLAASALSTGQRKRLEMARAMATQPRLLLLDEVTGGVDQRSIPGLIELVGRLRAHGVTLLVIEHNMRVIMSVADRIVALYMGRKLAEGRPEEVTRDPRLVEVYLGTGHGDRAQSA
jgi:branched-chain amino acid transport system ATP-binding protein